MTKSEAFECLYSFLATAQSPENADVIIAFGSYHKPVAEIAASLWLKKFAPYIVCTGAKTTLTEDIVGNSEADYFANIAVSMEVPDVNILREPNATNTGENISFSLKLLAEHSIYPKKILACAMPAHLRRIVATFAKQASSIEVIPILVPFEIGDYRTRSGMSLERRLVAELERLRTYALEGFTVPVVFPLEVLEAEKTIIELES